MTFVSRMMQSQLQQSAADSGRSMLDKQPTHFVCNQLELLTCGGNHSLLPMWHHLAKLLVSHCADLLGSQCRLPGKLYMVPNI